MSDATTILSGQGQQQSGEGGNPAGAAAGAPWFAELLAKESDAEFKNFVTNKNYPSPRDAIFGHYSAERMVGLDKAGRTVVLPKDDNDAEGRKAFYAKIGVPETPEGYKLPLPTGDDGKFAKIASSWFHSNGIPAKAAEGIAKSWNEYIASEVKAAEEAEKAQATAALEALRGEWGQSFDQRAEFGRRALRTFGKEAGLDDADLHKLESSIGTAKMMKLFSKLGEAGGEGGFAGGEGGSFGMTPADAQKQINGLIAKRMSGEINDHVWKTETEKELQKLMEIAASGGASQTP